MGEGALEMVRQHSTPLADFGIQDSCAGSHDSRGHNQCRKNGHIGDMSTPTQWQTQRNEEQKEGKQKWSKCKNTYSTCRGRDILKYCACNLFSPQLLMVRLQHLREHNMFTASNVYHLLHSAQKMCRPVQTCEKITCSHNF